MIIKRVLIQTANPSRTRLASNSVQYTALVTQHIQLHRRFITVPPVRAINVYRCHISPKARAKLFDPVSIHQIQRVTTIQPAHNNHAKQNLHLSLRQPISTDRQPDVSQVALIKANLVNLPQSTLLQLFFLVLLD